MATMDDGINGYIAFIQRNSGRMHNAAYLRRNETTIRILRQTPRDPAIVRRLLEQKQVKTKQA